MRRDGQAIAIDAEGLVPGDPVMLEAIYPQGAGTMAAATIGAYEYNSPGQATPTSTPTATNSATPTWTPTGTQTPTPTPTPTLPALPPAAYLPLIVNDSGATATPTSTATPSPERRRRLRPGPKRLHRRWTPRPRRCPRPRR